LITGDVHFAQLYQNKCPSLTGQKNLIEVCSSGLTHHIGEFIGLNYGVLELTFNPDTELVLDA
jgi:hypothetical protein